MSGRVDIDRGRGWRTGLFVAVLAAALIGVDAGETVGADEWQIEAGDERDREIVERYMSILEEDPSDEEALDRLVDHVGAGQGLEALIEDYRRRAQSASDRPHLWLIAGHLERSRGRYEQAGDHYERALEIDDDSAIGWYGRGRVRLRVGQRREAMEDFERALDRETDDRRRRELLEQLGELAFSHREFQRGKEFFDRLIDERPRDRHIRMDYVRLLVQYRQLEEALDEYEVLESLVGADARERANLLRDKAEVYEMKGDADGALETWEEALRLVRADSWLAAEIREGIVDAYRQSGRLAEFVDDYAGRWERGGTGRQMAVADVYTEIGELEEALEIYERVARADPSAIEVREQMIRVLERKGRIDDVAGIYRELIEAAPRTERYVFELVDHHIEQGDRDGARQVLDEADERFAGRARVRLEVADYYDQYNFRDRARRTYEAVLEDHSDDPDAVVEVGDYFYERGDRRRALEIWSKLGETRIGEQEGLRRRAGILVERGEVEEGLEVYGRLVEDHPDDGRVVRSMARALEEAQQWERAIEEWERLLELVDSARDRREARARIVELHEQRRRLEAELEKWTETFEQNEGAEAVEAGLLVAEGRMQTSQFEAAEEVLRSLEDHPAAGDEQRLVVARRLEQLYVRTGRYDEAVEVVERMGEEAFGGRARLMVRKSEYALEDGDRQRALEYGRRALEASPGDVEIREHVGDVHRVGGDDRAALDHYRTAVDIDPNAHQIRLKLGEVLAATGAVREAQDEWMEIVEEAGGGQVVRDAGERMLEVAVEADRLEALETRWAPLIFRVPMEEDHARLVSRLYDVMAGPLVLDAHHGDAGHRREARDQLDELGGRAATLLVEQLRADDNASVARALRRVAEMDLKMAAPQVGRLIEGADEPRLRHLAVVAAARLGDEDLADALERSLEGEAADRHLVVWALGHLEGERAREMLVEVLEETSPPVETALAALGLVGRGPTPETIEIVDAALEKRAEGSIREDRAGTMLLVEVAGRLVEAGEADEVESLRKTLETLAVKRDGPPGDAAARAVGGIGDVEAATVLWRLVLDEDQRRARRGEAGLVRMLSGSASSPEDWHRDVRFFDWSTGRFDAQKLVDAEVRRLGQRRGGPADDRWTEVVDEGLVRLLADEEETIEAAALDRIRDELGRDGDDVLWTPARATQFAKTVHQSGAAKQDHRLIELLAAGPDRLAGVGADGDDEMLRQGLWLMSVFDPDGEREELESMVRTGLNHPEPGVRRLALEAMASTSGRNGVDEELVERVVALVDDDDVSVRLAAVRAVGRMELVGARDRLEEIEDAGPAPVLRRAVREALRKLE